MFTTSRVNYNASFQSSHSFSVVIKQFMFAWFSVKFNWNST